MKSKNPIKGWEPAVQIKHPDNIESSSYSHAPKFIPSYETEPVNMFMLMSNEYSRIWYNEVEGSRKLVMKKSANVFLHRSYVIRGLLKKKKTTEAKKMFKMKQFENVPAKIQLIRCPLDAEEHSKQLGKEAKDRATETKSGPICDGDTCQIGKK